MRRDRRAANIRQMTHTSPKVEVIIDELILHGFPVSERYAIGEAVMREMGRRLAESNTRFDFQRDADLHVLDAGRISVSPPARPESVGAQIARAVHAGLSASSQGSK